MTARDGSTRARYWYGRLGGNVRNLTDGRIDHETFDRIAVNLWRGIQEAGLREDVLALWRADNEKEATR